MSWKYRSDEVSTLGMRDINLGSQTLVTTTTLTASSPKINFLNLAAGFTVTLPAAQDGLDFQFIVKLAPTTAYIIASATTDIIAGSVMASGGGVEDTEPAATGDQFNFVANTAVVGDRVHITSDGTSWFGFGLCSAAGAITITG